MGEVLLAARRCAMKPSTALSRATQDTPMDALAKWEPVLATRGIADKLETKAIQARKRASANFVLTMLIGMGILSLFFFAGPLTESVRLQQLEKQQAATIASQIELLKNADMVTKSIHELTDEHNNLNPKNESNSQSTTPITGNTTDTTVESHKTWFNELVDIVGGGASTSLLTSIIARIGAVLVGIFLIQILVSFARYNYKLSEHLSACADMVRISRGEAGIMKELAPVMLTALDFGKMPSSPFQKIVDTSMDTIKELDKKIPGK